MDGLSQKLEQWLAGHDHRLERFRDTIHLSIVGQEISESPNRIKQFLQHNAIPPYHLWAHTYAGRTSRSKPYCLRINGPDTVGLDWEDSVIGAAEAAFQRMNYQTAREIGTEEQLSYLISNPDLSKLISGINQRDLWALRKAGNEIDLYIIEAKGKEAYTFNYYCFAEALSQVFPVPAEPLGALLGGKKCAGHGLCWKFAQHLYNGWRASGLNPTVTVAILLPEWSPDVVWSGGKVQQIPSNFYARPLADFRKFLATGETATKSGTCKKQRAFGEVLDDLESNCQIRSLNQAKDGLRFRTITTLFSKISNAFELTGL